MCIRDSMHTRQSVHVYVLARVCKYKGWDRGQTKKHRYSSKYKLFYKEFTFVIIALAFFEFYFILFVLLSVRLCKSTYTTYIFLPLDIDQLVKCSQLGKLMIFPYFSRFSFHYIFTLALCSFFLPSV